MSIETMKLALEALQNSRFPFGTDTTEQDDAIQMLVNAIEQAQKQCQCPACKIKPHASDCPVHNEPAWPNGLCDCGAVEQAQKQEPVTYPENFIDALRYNTALREFEYEQAQKQDPVAGSNALMLADWLQANYEADEIDESAEELRKLHRENQLLWQEREEPHKQLEFYIRECNRLEAERDAALKTEQAQKQEPVAHWSDCAVHSEPAYPKGECDCGGYAPPQRQWVGLTDEDISEIVRGTHNTLSFVRAIEAKLKEKNT